MTTNHDVIEARAGDAAAFSRLVTAYADMARGYARSWLKDAAAAEDAAQEAFIEAFLRLDQLRTPEAFPAWLLRIVRKHCDRRTRRTEVVPPEPDPALEPAEAGLEAAERRAWLHAALDALPDHERIVVALHYLGEVPVKDVAAFLELSETAVKQRLLRARRRLERRPRDMTPTPRNDDFEDRIQLFLAIRAGDRDAVGAVLDRHPALVDRPEQWSAEEALSGGFTLAHRLTPLLAAVTRGDAPMVARLLERGAAVDGRCGCDAGETPLFAAALRGHAEIVRLLLAAGADPNPTNAAGQSAKDVARLRGHLGVLDHLEGSGARAGPALADQPSDQPSEGAAKVDGIAARARRRKTASGDARVVTGIRAVDLLAPLTEGMRVRVHAAAETGLMVLLAEMSLNLGRRRTVTWVSSPNAPWQRGEYASVAREYGLHDAVRVVEGLDRVGRTDVLVLFVPEGREAEVEAQLPRLLDHARLAFVVDAWPAVTRGDVAPPELAAPFDAVICTDPDLARAGVYPALDVTRTRSRASVGPEHARIAEAVRARAEEAAVRGVMAQPFEVYRHANGVAGEVSTLPETLEAFAAVT